jgi:hypothetical protein
MTIEVTLDSKAQAALRRFLRTAGGTDQGTRGPLPLTIAALTEMLLEDIAVVMTRPGSWEADAMAVLVGGHGHV